MRTSARTLREPITMPAIAPGPRGAEVGVVGAVVVESLEMTVVGCGQWS